MDTKTVNWRVKKITLLGVFTALTAILASCTNTFSNRVINVYAFADGFNFIQQAGNLCSTNQYKVLTHTLPKTADDQRLQLARRLANADSGLDVMTLDVVWTAEFANAGWIAPVPAGLVKKVENETLAGPLNTAKWQEKLFALPAWTNSLLLWYRKDLVNKFLNGKVPSTWGDMLKDSHIVGAAGGPTWIGIQGQQYEGLLVLFNSILESAGGQILSDDGKTVTLTDTPAHKAATVKALNIIKAIATDKGADPSITQSYEDIIRLGMENGKALFATNWPYVFAGMKQNAAAGSVPFLDLTKYATIMDNPTDQQRSMLDKLTLEKFAPAPYPKVYADKAAKVTVGGANFAVAESSLNKNNAFVVADCLRGVNAQKTYALDGGFPPSAKILYSDADFQKMYPMWKIIRDQLQENTAAIRPASPNYQVISTLLVSKLSPIGRNYDAEKLAEELAAQVKKAVAGEGIIP